MATIESKYFDRKTKRAPSKAGFLLFEVSGSAWLGSEAGEGFRSTILPANQATATIARPIPKQIQSHVAPWTFPMAARTKVLPTTPPNTPPKPIKPLSPPPAPGDDPLARDLNDRKAERRKKLAALKKKRADEKAKQKMLPAVIEKPKVEPTPRSRQLPMKEKPSNKEGSPGWVQRLWKRLGF